jgi:hypothetical protein
MFGISIDWDEKRDLTDIIRIINKSCDANKLYWLLLSHYSGLLEVEADSGISDLRERIEGNDIFSWEEVKKFAIGEHFQECVFAAFKTLTDLKQHQLTDDNNLYAIYLLGADYNSWIICTQDESILKSIESHFSHPKRLKDDWFQKYFYREKK